MSNYNRLKATINADIKQNGNQEITGSVLNSVLNQMVNILGAGYQFIGVATPTNPGTAQAPDYKCFYLATTPGTYTNLGELVVADGEVAILYWDTEWHKVSTGIASQEKLSELGQKLIEIKYFAENMNDAIRQGAGVGDIFYNTTAKLIVKINQGGTTTKIPYQEGAIYTHDGALYVYNGSDLVGVTLRGSYVNPDDVKTKGVYAQEDRGEGFAYAFLIVQKTGNTIVQLQFVIGVSNTLPSIQYRLSNDNGSTWGSWFDWIENAYSPYTPKTRTIYKFLKALGDTPNGEYYYNVNTLKVYQNNNGSAVLVEAREQDRYLYEGKQYIYYSDRGLVPLEDDILTISGYHPTTSSHAKNGTYYVVGNGLLYIVQAGVTSVPIPWEKGRKYQFDGALYYYNGKRLVRYDNTGVTISNPASARCVSDSFLSKAASASRVAITKNGIAYVVYMGGNNSWYESNTRVVLSVFPINRPEMAKNYVVAEYTDSGISGYLALPNVHLLQNGNVRILFSNYQTSNELMGIFYKDFDVENKTFGTLNQVNYNGSPITFDVLESIVGTPLETSDGIHVSGNLMNDFGVDGNGNSIKYFFINAADGNPVVFSTIDDFASVQLVKVLPITDRQYESALCKLGSTFYIYYRALSGSWLMTTTDWDTFTTPFQFSTLNNRSDIYSDGQKVYLCGANAEIDDVNKFRRTNAHILVGSGATIDGYEEIQEVHDERGLVELNYIHLGNTHIIVCSSSPIMIDNAGYDDRYRGKYGIYFIPIREARGIGLVF